LSAKKATEDFVQKVSFLLADVKIVVINELTWPDQEYLTAIAEAHRESKANGPNFIIVVHNYKETETMEDFIAMRKVSYTTDESFLTL
jgi:hypothetical protein